MSLSNSELSVSISGKKIRLTKERWRHIEAQHPELQGWKSRVLDTCAHPDLVVSGKNQEFLAAKSYLVDRRIRFLVVIYREAGEDGFIITAILKSKVEDLRKSEVLWPRP